MIKRYFAVFIIILIAGFTACGQKKETYETVYKGQSCQINTKNHTVSYDGEIYRYEITKGRVSITYPDGAGYFFALESGSIRESGWSEGYDPQKYIPGDDLYDILSKEIPSGNGKNYIVVIFCGVIGLWNLFLPYPAWYLSFGWRYEDAKPSSFALAMTRCAGLLILLFGAGYLFLDF